MTNFPAPILLEVGRRLNWRLVLILSAACVVSLLAVLPYTLTLQSATLAQTKFPIPLPFVLAIQVVVNGVLYSALAALGLFLAAKIGLGLPFLEGWLDGKSIWASLRGVAVVAALFGLVGGGIIIALDAGVFAGPMQQLTTAYGVVIPDSANPPAWQGFLASFYGGVTEEILLRLCVMTLLAWLGRFLGRTADNRPTTVIMWVANVIAAILFGLGHLPTMIQMGFPMTTLVIIRAVALNGVVGVAAGWLYSRWGLESAMICHFSADLVLHVATPLLASF